MLCLDRQTDVFTCSQRSISYVIVSLCSVWVYIQNFDLVISFTVILPSGSLTLIGLTCISIVIYASWSSTKAIAVLHLQCTAVGSIRLYDIQAIEFAMNYWNLNSRKFRQSGAEIPAVLFADASISSLMFLCPVTYINALQGFMTVLLQDMWLVARQRAGGWYLYFPADTKYDWLVSAWLSHSNLRHISPHYCVSPLFCTRCWPSHSVRLLVAGLCTILTTSGCVLQHSSHTNSLIAVRQKCYDLVEGFYR